MSVKSCLATYSKNTQFYLPDVKASVQRQTAKGTDETTAWAKALDSRISKLEKNLQKAYEVAASKYEKDVGPIKAGLNTVQAVQDKLREFVGGEVNGLKLRVVQTVDEAKAELKAAGAKGDAAESIDEGTQGFAWNGRAWLIADNIRKGRENAVFLHEVGSHLGMEGILTREQINKLVAKIKDWAADPDSEAWEYAFEARERAANTTETGARKDNEILAYFIEAAVRGGVTPSALKKGSQLATFFRTIWAAFKSAIRKLGINPNKLTAQDYVDIAYGAARLEMRGTWHGTAGDFRRFDHRYMGTGEGAQAFGWGTYLAQAVGIAKGYWKADVGRKASKGVKFNGTTYDVNTDEGWKAFEKALIERYPKYRNAVMTVSEGLAEGATVEKLIEDSKTYSAGYEYEGARVREILKAVQAAKPTGSLMRVDVNVRDDEFLDWDKPLSEQPKVLEQVGMYMPQNMQDELVENVNADIAEMTGEDFYRGLQAMEAADGVLSELMDTEEVNAILGKGAKNKAMDKEFVSRYLNSIGIKGIRFLDANSRGKGEGSRNLVIFNDKNIVRVATEVGADPGRVKFSHADKAPNPVNAESARQIRTILGGTGPLAGKLNLLADLTGNEALRSLVNGIAPLLMRNPPNFVFHPRDAFDARGNLIAAAYVGETHSVEFGPSGLNLKTVLHEIVHAVTVSQIERAEALIRGEKVTSEENDRLLIQSYQHLRSIQQASNDLVTYGFTSVAEMVSEAFVNPAFQAKLRKMNPLKTIEEERGKATFKITSAFAQVVQAVKTALGLGAIPTSALEQVMDASAVFFKSQAGAEKAYADMVQELPPQLRTTAGFMGDWMKSKLSGLTSGWMFGSDFADSVKNLLPSAKKYFDLLAEKGALRRHWEVRIEEIMQRVTRLSPADQKRLGDFLKEYTLNEKWGHQPAWKKGAVEIDAEAKAKWDALGKMHPEFQSIADAMLQHGDEVLQKKREVLNQEITEEYAAILAQETGDKREATVKEMGKRIRREGVELAQLKGPYLPIKRFGDYVVVGKSQAYLDAEEANNTKEIDRLKASHRDYRVEFFNSEYESIQARAQMEAMGPYASVRETVKQKYHKDIDKAPFQQMQKLKEMITAELGVDGTKGAGAINKAMSQLYVNTLEEMHSRKSELKRMKVAGARGEEMFNAFLTQGRADAHLIASLLKNREVVTTLSTMRQEAKEAPEAKEASRAINEVLMRQAAMFDYQENEFANKTMSFTSTWLLLTSPAYFAQNLSQPWMMSLPFMAGRYGQGNAVRALTQGYRDIAPLVEQMKFWKRGDSVAMDLSGIKNTTGDANLGERQLMDRMRDLGLLDIGMESDMGALTGKGAIGRRWDGAVKKLRDVARNVEIVNRASAGLAAYRLSHAKTEGGAEAKHAAATKYAIEVVRRTHGDFSAFNAPRLMQGNVMRVLTQFRKFQVMQVTLLVKTSIQAFPLVQELVSGKKLSPEQRAEALVQARILGWTLANTAVIGGAIALPGMNLVAALATMLMGGEDEPDKDMETEIRNWLGEDNKAFADLLLRGTPTMLGVDFRRIGMGNTLSLFPFSDVDLSGRDGYAKTLLGMMGPGIGGVGSRAADGIGLIQGGFYWKGLENLMPKGLTDPSKALREQVQGVTSRNGDVIYNNMTGWDSIQQALGQMSANTYERQRTRRFGEKGWGYKKDIDSSEQGLTTDYTQAAKRGDREEMVDLRKRWMTLQKEKRELGFKPSPMSSLIRAPASQRRREREKQALLE